MTKLRKLGWPTGHRMSMVSQLVKHVRIETTACKGEREVHHLADNMIQLGKEILVGGLLDLCGETMFSTKFERNCLIDTKTELVDAQECCELALELVMCTNGLYRLISVLVNQSILSPLGRFRQSKPATPQPPARLPLDPDSAGRRE